MNCRVYSLKKHPGILEEAIAYFQKHWADEDSAMVYDDCMRNCLCTDSPLPQWYLLKTESQRTIGCVGLITNDFISRMDLYPWLCALYIEEDCRGQALGKLLIDAVKQDAAALGYRELYLCSDHVGYYEHYGFERIGTGFHPWGETSEIFRCEL